MFLWKLLQAVCIPLVCVCVAYEDDIKVSYPYAYDNEIAGGETPEPTTTSVPCSSRDLNKWDKLFSMLENSQMRENMLLQYADEIIKVEMESLRGEMLRFVAQYGGSCGVAVESAGRRMSLQIESHFREALGSFKCQTSAGTSVSNSSNLEVMLQQLLSTARTSASRLSKLETSCFTRPGAGMGMNTKTGFQLRESRWAEQEQEVTSREAALDGVLDELQRTRVELVEVLRLLKKKSLPAGCEMALLFPLRSHRIYTSVTPDVPLSTSTFTVCMWVKPTTVSNKTVLFSYGNRRNPHEIQLLLSQTSAFFTIGGEAHLVEARGVVNPGEWIHLCGAWSSEQGLASLWAGGEKVTSTPGVAEGHVLPSGGSLQLGQERNGYSESGGVPGFEAFDSKLAFAGKMTGVNMWDRVLSEEEISQLAFQEGLGCERRGNMVAWGVTEMVPHGGAQFIN